MPRYEIRNHFLFKDGKQVPYLPTPNRGGLMNPIAIIDHDTASNPLDPKGDIGWLRMPRAGASAHVVIDWYGNIFQLVPFNVQAWHAGPSAYGKRRNYNSFSIGIEHDNPGYLRKIGEGVYQGVCVIDTTKNPQFHVAAAPVQHDPRLIMYWLGYSQAQLEASTQLHIALKAAYPAIDEVLAHWHICPRRKTDTNPLFPLARMQSLIRGNRQDLPTKTERVAEVMNDPKAEAATPIGGLAASYGADMQAQSLLNQAPQVEPSWYGPIKQQLFEASASGLSFASQILLLFTVLFLVWLAFKYGWQAAKAVYRYFRPVPVDVQASDYQPAIAAADELYPIGEAQAQPEAADIARPA